MIIRHTKRNVIRIHERLIATKHTYNGFIPFFICSTIVFFTALVVSELFKTTDYTSDRGAILSIAIIFILLSCGGVILLAKKNKSSPYKRMIYDTKFKWFRVYHHGFYHIIRPSDVVRVQPRKINKYYEDENTKEYGYLIITTVDYTKEKNIYKKLVLFCTNPKEAKYLMDQCIEEKLIDDFNKVDRSRKVAKIQSTRIKYKQAYEKTKDQVKKEMEEIKKKDEQEDTSFNAWD